MLTPIELQGKGFKTGFGYDKKDVEAFLKEVIKDYEHLYKENLELNDKINVLSEGVQYYKSIEKTLQKALVLAEKAAQDTEAAATAKAEAIVSEANVTADRTKQEAIMDAERIVTEARTESKHILFDAQKEFDKIQLQISSLLQTYEKYRIQYKQLLTAQFELLESDSYQLDYSQFKTLSSDKEDATTFEEVRKVFEETSEESVPLEQNDMDEVVAEDMNVQEDAQSVEDAGNNKEQVSESVSSLSEDKEEVVLPSVEQVAATELIETDEEDVLTSVATLDMEELTAEIEEDASEADKMMEVSEESTPIDDDFIPIIDIKSILAEVEAQEKEKKAKEALAQPAPAEEQPSAPIVPETKKEKLEELSEEELLHKLFGADKAKTSKLNSKDVNDDFEFLNI